jgi:outer membrane immunogenic protein
MVKKLLLSCAALILMGAMAKAADIIEPTAYDWTGPYIGLQGGYAWGENDVEVGDPVTAAIAGFSADSDPITLNPPADGSIGIDGWAGGLHLGYLWQHDSLVLGIEGDGEFADIDGDTDVFANAGDTDPTGTLEQDIDWLASLRLRAGFAMDRALIYATGGLAVGGVELTAEDNASGDSLSESDTQWGWTVGGGLDYAFTDDLSGRVEYRYTDLGKSEITVEGQDFEVDATFHAVRAGLSWHFGAI